MNAEKDIDQNWQVPSPEKVSRAENARGMKRINKEIEPAVAYVRQNPYATAAGTVVAGVALGALVGTRTGRKLLKTAFSLALPVVTSAVYNYYVKESAARANV